ncbi:bifunctional tetrahydrofolate synthase/dihydrofolate synthase [Marinomonas epiphytica]
MAQRSLDEWLSYIESQHPSEIELGLERGKQVLDKLAIGRPKERVITLAGTNGKGSSCAMLTHYLSAQGYSVGTYTSPHFIAFNERIAINGRPCGDDLICQAFTVIEEARADIPLTYFEFSTLAGLWIFDRLALDYWVLEVGLGGRLDSVNMVDTDVAVITSIALDHTDWLGNNLEDIGREKAGIARPNKLLVSGVVNPPDSIASTAKIVKADLKQKGADFHFNVGPTDWSWYTDDVRFEALPLPQLPIENAATVLAVLHYMGLSPSQQDLSQLFSEATLTGRFQRVSSAPDVYIDVAHNPEAALELRSRITPFEKQPIAVCGMLKDKDILQVIQHLKTSFAAWHVTDLPGPRAASAAELSLALHETACSASITQHSTLQDAYIAALKLAQQQARAIVLFGSFVTVTEYLNSVQEKPLND